MRVKMSRIAPLTLVERGRDNNIAAGRHASAFRTSGNLSANRRSSAGLFFKVN